MSTQVNAIESTTGGRLVTADGRTLPLRGVRVTADARGGVASVVLEQRFENPYDEPLRVTYLFPLPADGAVSGYAFSIGERRVVGEVDRRAAARERFERALVEGRTAGIVDQERSSLFTQELGNVPPRAQVTAELRVDQRLRWLDEGAWEWRFPTAAGPRYTGAPGRVADAARTEIAVADGPLPARLTLSLTVRDDRAARPASPVLPLAAREASGGWQIELAEEGGMRLDRDVVVTWAVTAPRVGVTLDPGQPVAGNGYALMTLVPPQPDSAEARPRPRDLILLLDTSGSMGGEPLAQVKKVCAALIASLGERDRLEMIEFSSSARRWQRGAASCDEKTRRKAQGWLAGLQAGGGTEMVSGVLEALAPLGPESQRQVVLLTDGYIGFEHEVTRVLSDKLPPGTRLHVVGVGSAVNRSLTLPAARVGRGVEVIVAPGEDAERAARRVLARTAAPIVTDVEVRGACLRRVAPGRLPDLHAGAPALAALEVDPAGGQLVVRGRTAFGFWEQTVNVPPQTAGLGSRVPATLFARERVEDLEIEQGRDEEIERLGLAFQIATRLTTWIAVSKDVTVDPTAPTRNEIVPQELPHGVALDGLGLATTAEKSVAGPQRTTMISVGATNAAAPPPPPAGMPPQQAPPKTKAGGILFSLRELMKSAESDDAVPAEPEPAKDARGDTGSAGQRRGRDVKPSPERKEAAPAPLRLRARVRLSETGALVLEIELPLDIAWSPAGDATVRFADGSLVAAAVDTARTTRAAALRAGQTARLAVTFAAQPGRAVEVTLRLGAMVAVIEVLPA